MWVRLLYVTPAMRVRYAERECQNNRPWALSWGGDAEWRVGGIQSNRAALRNSACK